MSSNINDVLYPGTASKPVFDTIKNWPATTEVTQATGEDITRNRDALLMLERILGQNPHIGIFTPDSQVATVSERISLIEAGIAEGRINWKRLNVNDSLEVVQDNLGRTAVFLGRAQSSSKNAAPVTIRGPLTIEDSGSKQNQMTIKTPVRFTRTQASGDSTDVLYEGTSRKDAPLVKIRDILKTKTYDANRLALHVIGNVKIDGFLEADFSLDHERLTNIGTIPQVDRNGKIISIAKHVARGDFHAHKRGRYDQTLEAWIVDSNPTTNTFGIIDHKDLEPATITTNSRIQLFEPKAGVAYHVTNGDDHDHSNGFGAKIDLTAQKNVGNSRGEVPISNGLRCEGLNADTVDGLHGANLLTKKEHDNRDHSPIAGSIPHDKLSGIGQNSHHNRRHALSSKDDHSGGLIYSQISGIVKTSGVGNTSTLIRSNHQHTGQDGSTKLPISSIEGLSTAFDRVIDASEYDSSTSAGTALKEVLADTTVESIFIKSGTYSIDISGAASGTINISDYQTVVGESNGKVIIELTGSLTTPQYAISLGIQSKLSNVKIDGSTLTGAVGDVIVGFAGSSDQIPALCSNVYVVSTTNITSFKSTGVATHLASCINCVAHNGYNGYENIANCEFCRAYNASNYAFSGCQGLNGSVADGNSYATSRGFYNCARLSNCVAVECLYGFHSSNWISDSAAAACQTDGWYKCGFVSASTAINTTVGSGFNVCTYLAGCYANNNNEYGFVGDGVNGGWSMSSCTAINSGSDGFYLCVSLSGCRAVGNTRDGFRDCREIAGCAGNANTGNGFYQCSIMSAIYAEGNTGYGITDNNTTISYLAASYATGNIAGNYFFGLGYVAGKVDSESVG